MPNKLHLLFKPDTSIFYRLTLLFIALMITLVDQFSKYYIKTHFTIFEVKAFLPGWNWTLSYNQGAAFSLLSNQGGWQKVFFVIIALVVSIGLITYILKQIFSRLTGLAMSFVLGGAMGNVIDRIINGKVTDFIDWYYATHHWPTFNLADSFIVTGVSLIIIEGVFFLPGKRFN